MTSPDLRAWRASVRTQRCRKCGAQSGEWCNAPGATSIAAHDGRVVDAFMAGVLCRRPERRTETAIDPEGAP